MEGTLCRPGTAGCPSSLSSFKKVRTEHLPPDTHLFVFLFSTIIFFYIWCMSEDKDIFFLFFCASMREVKKRGAMEKKVGVSLLQCFRVLDLFLLVLAAL